MSLIPKKLHFIWVGDEALRPDNLIDTWRQLHPDYEIRIWGNQDWQHLDWVNRDQMDRISGIDRGYAGVADLMRWEILLREGGFALDADSVCLRRLPDWLFDCDLFAVWENEFLRPGLVANGYVGARPGHSVIRAVVDELHSIKDITRQFVWRKLKYKERKVWQTTGPVPFSRALMADQSRTATILPSHFFLPMHHSGDSYKGHGPVYACEFFAGTHDVYQAINGKSPDEVVQLMRRTLGLEELDS